MPADALREFVCKAPSSAALGLGHVKIQACFGKNNLRLEFGDQAARGCGRMMQVLYGESSNC
jgi:hypothetical protein